MTYNTLIKTIDNNAPDGLKQRYMIYLGCADDGNITTGKPLKTFLEWINS